jgi:hypothetical protein
MECSEIIAKLSDQESAKLVDVAVHLDQKHQTKELVTIISHPKFLPFLGQFRARLAHPDK